MTETRLVLVTVAVLVRAPAEHSALKETLDSVSDRLQRAVEQVVDADPILESTRCTSFRYPDDEGVNAYQCSVCGDWTTDEEQPEMLAGLTEGYKVGDVYCCNICHTRNKPDAV